MYLSRLLLNPRSRAVRRDLANCHALHRTVMAAFPQASASSKAARREHGVLYRLDTDRDGDRLVLYVQSRACPDWSRLPAGYLLPSSNQQPNPAVKPIDRVYERLRAGATLRFRLRANPVKRARSAPASGERRRPGKIVPILETTRQVAWLQRRATLGGFALLGVDRVIPEGVLLGWKERGENAKLLFHSVVFEGILRVTDADRFRATLTQGIGKGLAYGLGLLTIAPVRLVTHEQ